MARKSRTKTKRAKAELGENKSQAIRNYKRKHPSAKPKDIAANLQKAGYDVSAQYVSTILSSDKRKGNGAVKKGGGLGRRRKGELSKGDLLLVKQLVAQTGSVKAAKDVVDDYSDLMA